MGREELGFWGEKSYAFGERRVRLLGREELGFEGQLPEPTLSFAGQKGGGQFRQTSHMLQREGRK